MPREDPVAQTVARHGKDLPDSVRKLGWISFFTDFASEMTYPIVPLFLSATLGAPAAVLGIIEGVAEAIVSLMKGASGWYIDRSGKRVTLIRLGYGLSALSKPLLSLAFFWPFVFFARSLDRLGKGVRTTARDALVAESIDKSMAGRAYGFHRAMDTSGAIVGALAALGLLWLLPGSYRVIFLLAALPGAWAVWLTFQLCEAQPQAPPPPQRGEASPRLREVLRSLPQSYWRTLVPLALFALANSSDAFLLLRAKDLGLSDAEVVLAYVLFNMVYAASAYPMGILGDRVGRWPLLCCGWVIYAGVYLGLGSLSVASVWWLLPVYGLYMGLAEGASKAVVAVLTEPGTRGMAIGLFQMCVGLMTLAGSILAGVLWDAYGPGSAFRFGAGMAFAALLAVLILAPWRKPVLVD